MSTSNKDSENSSREILKLFRNQVILLQVFSAISSFLIAYFVSNNARVSILVSIIFSLIVASFFPRIKKKFLVYQLKKMIGDFDFTDDFDFENFSKSSIEEALENSWNRQRSASNHEMLRDRPSDEKGMTSGVYNELDKHKPRIDAIANSADWDGLEGELTSGEELVRTMNKIEAEIANKAWQEAEKRDMDNVEFGVERLGDLVASGYFEKNAEEGAFRKLVESNQED